MSDMRFVAALAFLAMAGLAGAYLKGFADGAAEAAERLQAAHAEQLAAIAQERDAEAEARAAQEAEKAAVSAALAGERRSLETRLSAVRAELARLRTPPPECALTEAEALNLNELRRVRRAS